MNIYYMCPYTTIFTDDVCYLSFVSRYAIFFSFFYHLHRRRPMGCFSSVSRYATIYLAASHYYICICPHTTIFFPFLIFFFFAFFLILTYDGRHLFLCWRKLCGRLLDLYPPPFFFFFSFSPVFFPFFLSSRTAAFEKRRWRLSSVSRYAPSKRKKAAGALAPLFCLTLCGRLPVCVLVHLHFFPSSHFENFSSDT